MSPVLLPQNEQCDPLAIDNGSMAVPRSEVRIGKPSADEPRETKVQPIDKSNHQPQST